MELTAFKLNFNSPIHLSDARSDYGSSNKMIHSDTFYAALISVLTLMGEEGKADLGCTISSLFPYTTDLEKGDTIYFFPKPYIALDKFINCDDIKKLKRIEWLDKDYFIELLNGEIDSEDNGNGIQKNFLCKRKFDADFIISQVIPRVRVPRSSEDGEGKTDIFYIEKLYYKENSGLYFLAYGNTELLEKALNLLQYEGVGTDRNVGFGQFSFEKITNFDLPIPNNTNGIVSLSLFNPEKEEDIKEMTASSYAAWEIIKRGGWLTNQADLGKRKKSVYMFSEGSIFSKGASQIEVLGKVDINLKPETTENFVAPEHPVWRNGRALFLPIKMN